ncbi:DUF4240 domain-containing protein [Plantactinospora sp. S1510]|uniref:DUF4240 domain-containing protein n=1 Tax=Plantactinospora alkalitolerans TaxID=2789879 RepID=A0ABS0H7U6_9ACTN|nr:DUF4240 domain-containing protein [Plantactinospora alkalitolerans]MBF9134258.1 DUF4240 domain-containing protein [Plantactinospora alkalitolerans]
MDEARFWKIVDGTLVDPCRQAELLTDALAALSASDVLGFRRQFVAAHRRAYTRRMWLAAALLHSDPRGDVDLSDDGFTDYRSWLITRGQHSFDLAVSDPDTIIDLPVDGCHDLFCHGETFAAVPDDVYEELSGQEVPIEEDIVEMLGDLPDPPVDRSTAGLLASYPRLTSHRKVDA